MHVYIYMYEYQFVYYLKYTILYLGLKGYAHLTMHLIFNVYNIIIK